MIHPHWRSQRQNPYGKSISRLMLIVVIAIATVRCGTTPPQQTTPTSTPISSLPEVVTSSQNAESSFTVGDLSQLQDDATCDGTGGLITYAETENYLVYICADPNDPTQPRYYRSKNRDGSGGLEIEAKDYNPLQGRYLEFNNQGYIYTLQIPTAQIANPDFTVKFPNGREITEKVTKYLAKQSSLSTKTSTDPDDSALTAKEDQVEPSAVLTYVYSHKDSLGVCPDKLDQEVSQKSSDVYPIDDRTYFVKLLCFMAAYQGNYEFLVYTKTSSGVEVKSLSLTLFSEDESGEITKTSDRSIAGLPDYDPSQQILSVFTKFRGLGDCGSVAKYKLVANELNLQEFRAKFDCDGKYVEPSEYPQFSP